MADALERAVTIDLDGSLALEGIFLAGPDAEAIGAVVAPPHPLMGGSMDHPVVNELAYAIQRAECAALRFNWRGVGASGGAPSGEIEDGDADYSAATRFVEESGDAPLLAAGYSYGAAMALRAAARHPRIRRLLLVAPPEQMLATDVLASFGGSVLIVAAENDTFASSGTLERVSEELPRGSFHLVPEADHFFSTGLAEIPKAVANWL